MHVSTPMKRQSLPGDTTSALSWDTELSPGRSAPLDIYLLYPAGELRQHPGEYVNSPLYPGACVPPGLRGSSASFHS